MDSRFLLIVAVITLQFSFGSAQEKIPLKKDLIVSPDWSDNTNDTKKEVEHIRDAVNDETPIPTFLQLHDTAVVRTKINDAVSHGKYAEGKPIPDDINLQLHAKKEFSSAGPNVVANAKPEQTNDAGILDGIDAVDTSTKKDLSNANDPKAGDKFPPIGWMSFRKKQEKPLIVKDSKMFQILRLPIWFTLRRGFVSNFAAHKD